MVEKNQSYSVVYRPLFSFGIAGVLQLVIDKSKSYAKLKLYLHQNGKIHIRCVHLGLYFCFYTNQAQNIKMRYVVATDREPVNFRVSKTTHNWLEKMSGKLSVSRNIIAKHMILMAIHDLDARYYPFVFSMMEAKSRNEPNWVKPKSNKASNKLKSKSLKNADDFEDCCKHISDLIQQFNFMGLQYDENKRCGAIIKIIKMFCALHDNNFKDFNLALFGEDKSRERMLQISRNNEPRMMQ